MLNVFRWLLALPAGFLAGLVAHVLLGFMFGIAHGFEEVATLWDSTDMAGMPISGTYIVLGTRLTSTAVFLGIFAYIIPAKTPIVAIGLASVFSVFAIGMFVYLIYMVFQTGYELGVSGWYRNILETISYIVGSFLGAGMGSSLGGHNVNA